MKLTKLVVGNFQILESKTITLSEKINIICGRTDTGKSTTFRALESLFLNKYTDGFFTIGTKFYRIGARLKNKHEIIKTRRQQTTYTIDGKEHKAVGRGIPDVLKDYVNLEPENFQKQHNPYFLINKDYDSPSQVAASLNKISGMGDATKAISLINSDIRNEEASIKLLQEERLVLDKNTEELLWTEDAIRRLDKISKLQQLIEKLYEFRLILFQLKSIPEGLDQFKESVNELYELRRKVNPVVRTLNEYKSLKRKQRSVPETEKFKELYKKLVATREKQKRTTRLMSDYKRYKSELNEVNDVLENNKCPTCRSAL